MKKVCHDGVGWKEIVFFYLVNYLLGVIKPSTHFNVSGPLAHKLLCCAIDDFQSFFLSIVSTTIVNCSINGFFFLYSVCVYGHELKVFCSVERIIIPN